MENNTGTENVYKIFIQETSQRRLFHPKLHENLLDRLMHRKKTSGTKRCLFGKSDPDDTKRMLEEQYAMDQGRFLAKFGFDIETIEHLERTKGDASENIENDPNGLNRTTGCNVFGGNVKNLGRKILKARRKMSFNNKAQAGQSQKCITDFYQARKSNSQPLEKKATPQTSNNASLET